MVSEDLGRQPFAIGSSNNCTPVTIAELNGQRQTEQENGRVGYWHAGP